MPQQNQKVLEQIVFINDKPADCGCTILFSDGHGHYSDVWTVTPCATHSRRSAFGPAEVKRDEHGYWWHPDIPLFDGGEDVAPYVDWLKEQRLEVKGWHYGDEMVLDDNGEEGVSAWQPESPGPEWFLMGIFESEDGAYVQWAKRVAE